MDNSQLANSAMIAAEPFQCRVKHLPIKRVFDILFSVTVLTLLSPLFLLIILAIKMTSRGKSVYCHQRVGRGGKTFRCFKFRTMYSDADLRLEKLLESDPRIKEEWEKSYKLKNDPRVTTIGHFLRKTSLDELPQFVNVLKGDLSVVGPRPVIKEELTHFFGIKAYKILSVRPGITGLWQVSGRSDTTYETRVAMDEQYIDNHSFLFDLKLILKTIPCMFSFKGAY